MKQIKFCNLVSSDTNLKANDFFKSKLIEFGIEVDYSSLAVSELPLEDLALKKFKEFDFLRLHFDDSSSLLNYFEKMPSDVQAVSGFDFVIKKNGILWPQIYFTKVLREMIVAKSPDHNTAQSAYVISDGAIGRALVSIFVQMGHKKIVWVTDKEAEARQNIDYIQRVHLGSEIVTLSRENLTQQVDRASILVSTLTEALDLETINDLVYFNFMPKDSLVIDLNSQYTDQSTLVVEAGNAFLKSISSLECHAQFDVSILRAICPDRQISEVDYLDQLRVHLRET